MPQKAHRAADSHWADRLARLGFCARGLVYVIVGVLAFEIARGRSGQESEASKDGALRAIADRSFGAPLLAVLAVGLAGYAAWRASEAIWGKQDEADEKKRTVKRLASGAKAVLYFAFLASTVKLLASGAPRGGGGGDEQEKALTARVMEATGGRWLAGAVGAAIIVGAIYTVYRGISQKFDEKLDTSEIGDLEGKVIDTLGTVGMAARGLVFGLAGYLLVRAAVDFDPQDARGVDGTLHVMAQQAYGQVLLTVTAVGIVCYGLYSFAEARYRDL